MKLLSLISSFLSGRTNEDPAPYVPKLDFSRPVTNHDLCQLQKTLWLHHEPEGPRGIGWSEEVGLLRAPEVEAILKTVETNRLVCAWCSVGFGFGQIGLCIYEDEMFPGTGPTFLFCLSEKHLDPQDYPWVDRPTYGSVRQEATALFSTAGRAENVERLKWLGIPVQTEGSLAY